MVNLKPTFDDALAYVLSVEEAFHDEPAKYKQFLKILKDLRAHIINDVSAYAMVNELMKEKQELLHGFHFYVPDVAMIPISPEAEQLTTRDNNTENMVGTIDGALTYVIAVKKAFHDEPAKYDEFTKIMQDLKAQRIDKVSAVAMVNELLKEHQELLSRFNLFFPAEATPEADQKTSRAINKRIRVEKFMCKLKESIDPHAFVSFLEIVTKPVDRNKSMNELHEEVATLFQGHEDLVMEFRSLVIGPTDP